MKKKVLLLSLALMLVLTGVVSAAAAWGKYKGYDIIRIMVDGKTVAATDAPAINFNGRTMVPIYMLKDAGVKYSWDEKSKTAVISSSSNSIDPTKSTKEIINQGGYGVTISNISGKLTATTYFEQKTNFEQDWIYIDKIFRKLVDFNSTYSRVVYVKNDQTLGTVEILTANMKGFINGTITLDQINNLWITFGPIFQNNSNNTNSSSSNTSGSNEVSTKSPELYSNDLKTYLGKLTTNKYDSDSVFNSYGTYGSKYGSDSIWNEYGTYGGAYSNESVFNKYASKPPAIVLNDKVVGYLTINTTISGAISPVGLEKYLENKGY